MSAFKNYIKLAQRSSFDIFSKTWRKKSKLRRDWAEKVENIININLNIFSEKTCTNTRDMIYS